ncbi:MAG: hypothetical protein RIR70_1697, partial [Pseudomonadota bacterium]
MLRRLILIAAATSLAFPHTVLGADEALRAAEQLLATGQTESMGKAVRLLDEAIRKGKKNFRARYLRAVVLIDLEQYREASEALEALAAEYPRIAEIHNNRGIAYFGLKDYARAMKSFEEAIRLKPKYTLAFENLTLLHLSLAEASISQAKKLDPANANVAGAQSALESVLRQFAPGPMLDTVPQAAQSQPAPTTTGIEKTAMGPVANAEISWAGVISAVKRWVAAQENQNVEHYLATYAAEFTPADTAMSRSDWEAAKT